MIDYGLRPNERLIYECPDIVADKGKFRKEKGTLILTDQALIWFIKGAFERVKDTERYPLLDIKVFDNKAQITLKEERGSTPKIIVYFSKIQIAFEISDRAKAIDMANKINRVVTGTNQDLFVKRYLPGTEFIAETLKGTATKFMSVFNKDNEN